MRKFLTMLLVSLVALVVWTAPSYASVEFGGQYRLRLEAWAHTDFNDDNDELDDEAFYGQRVRLWGVAKPTDDTTIKLTIQDTRYWGVGSRAYINGGPGLTDEGENVIDLHESWLQINNIFDTPIAVKIGRQELAYGDQRLVGNFDWSNNARSFDAIKLMYASDTFDVDLWTAKINETTGPVFSPSTDIDEDQDFYGAYGTVKTIPNNTLDLYVLYLRDGNEDCILVDGGADHFASGSMCGWSWLGISEQNLWTYGTRLKGAAMGIDYTGEIAFQTGEINSTVMNHDLDAYAYAIRAGYTVPGGPMDLRVGAEYVFASGDDDGSDTDIETFSNLFPTNHSHMGYMDLQAWRNVSAWNINVSAKPTPKLTARLDYWDFTLDEETDDWYGAGNWMNNVEGVRDGCGVSGPSCPDDHVGTEVDLTVNYAYNSAVGFQAGVSRFMADDFIADNLEPDDEADMDWAYLMITANF